MKKVLMLITLSFAFLIGGVGSQTVDAVKQPQSAFKKLFSIFDFDPII
ncbi:hypothetical protein [Lentilactobacillus buchneri]|nr:hypothetical protein [Lentilactobacillus buchneri]